LEINIILNFIKYYFIFLICLINLYSLFFSTSFAEQLNLTTKALQISEEYNKKLPTEIDQITSLVNTFVLDNVVIFIFVSKSYLDDWNSDILFLLKKKVLSEIEKKICFQKDFETELVFFKSGGGYRLIYYTIDNKILLDFQLIELNCLKYK